MKFSKYYLCWKKHYKAYMQLLESPMMDIGHYSMLIQAVYYSMCYLIEYILKECENEKYPTEVLKELNDCVTNICSHILKLHENMTHPYDATTLEYLYSLFLRLSPDPDITESKDLMTFYKLVQEELEIKTLVEVWDYLNLNRKMENI